MNKEIKQEENFVFTEIFNQTGLLVMTRENDDRNVDSDEDQMFMGYKTLLVRSLANLTYATREIQDYIREEQGIPLVLSCCAFQDPNPCKFIIVETFLDDECKFSLTGMGSFLCQEFV